MAQDAQRRGGVASWYEDQVPSQKAATGTGNLAGSDRRLIAFRLGSTLDSMLAVLEMEEARFSVMRDEKTPHIIALSPSQQVHLSSSSLLDASLDEK